MEATLNNSSTGAVIGVRGLAFAYGDQPILDGISFCVGAGEHVSILGPNGSGKSTLLKCLIRIIEPKAGAITVLGHPHNRISRRMLARCAAYVPQARFSQVAFTVQAFLRMARYPHVSGWTSLGEGDEAAVQRAMDQTGTTPFAHRPVGSLSGGEAQKVLIAAALVQETPILLLDEATAFLDVKHQNEIHRLLTRLNRDHGKTILSVTHDINHAALTSSRILALRAGRLVFDGTPEALMTPNVLGDIFADRFLFTAHPTTGAPLVVPRAVQ